MFGMPLDKAAAQVGMGRTLFKKVCRREGIERWPYGYGYNDSRQADAEGSRSHPAQPEQHEQQADELEDEVEWPQGLEVDFDESDGWRPPPITEAAAAPAGPPPQTRPEPRPKPKPKATARQPRRVRPQDECEQCMPGSGKRRGHVGRHTTNPLGGRSRGRAPYGFNVTKKPAAAAEKAEAPSEDDCPACMRQGLGVRPNRAHTCDKAGRYRRKEHPRSQPAIAAVRNEPRAEPDAEDSAAPAGQEAAADTHEVYELDDQSYDIEPELPAEASSNLAAAGTGRRTSSRSPSVSPSVSTSSSPSSSPGPPQKKRAPVPKKAWEEEEIGESSEGRGAGGFRKKMAWSPAEDEQLLALVAQHGPQKWSVIAEHVSPSRTITISILGCPACASGCLTLCARADAEEGWQAVPRAVAEPAPPHHQQGPPPPPRPFRLTPRPAAEPVGAAGAVDCRRGGDALCCSARARERVVSDRAQPSPDS